MPIDVNSIQSQSLNAGLPTIKVIGVGGGGGNVINRMINDGVTGVQYIAANTDVMVLNSSKAEITIPLGSKSTKGLGAGMKPEIGRLAAEEDANTIKSILENTDLIFIAAGMGGGTGTGAAPVIAEIAKEMKVLTVGVVTTPFCFEGYKRMKIADDGIEELKKHVDTLMVIPNDKLLEIASSKTTMSEAFSTADDVLKQAIGGITGLINLKGDINLDFADLKTVMRNKGRAIMGTGVAKGENRGLEAAKKAISSPLLSDKPISGARGVIINVVADDNFSLLDAKSAGEYIENSADQDADVLFGLVTDENKEDEVIITVIATGFDHPLEEQDIPPNTRPLRIVDSLKRQNTGKMRNTKAAKLQKAGNINEINGESQTPGDGATELKPEEIGLQAVEDKLHYPSQSHSRQDNNGESDMDLQNLDFPAFMRNKNLKRK